MDLDSANFFKWKKYPCKSEAYVEGPAKSELCRSENKKLIIQTKAFIAQL